jgi:hypothetical protein
MNEFIKLSERFPEENDLVYFHDGNGDIYRGLQSFLRSSLIHLQA